MAHENVSLSMTKKRKDGTTWNMLRPGDLLYDKHGRCLIFLEATTDKFCLLQLNKNTTIWRNDLLKERLCEGDLALIESGWSIYRPEGL